MSAVGAVLDRVEAELRAFWATPPSPGDLSRARVCTMNLVVVTPPKAGRESVDAWVRVVDEVLLELPARALVVGLDPAGAPALEAGTTAVCTAREGGGLVCSERVTLVARGELGARLHSCVASLCVTDVPTVLVWLGPVDADDPGFAGLARDASRIVVDARQGSLAGLAKLVYWMRARPEGDRPGIGELTWTRLAPWQEMCARMFDEPRLRPLADHIVRVTLEQASTPAAPLAAEGTLLLGWLATRLGWVAPSHPASSGGPGVDVHLVARPSSGASPGALLAVRLEAIKEGVVFRGAIVREAGPSDAASWRLEVQGQDGSVQHIEQHVRLRADETAALLDHTLHRPLHDSALADAVAWGDALEGEELACGLEGDNVGRVCRLVRGPAGDLDP